MSKHKRWMILVAVILLFGTTVWIIRRSIPPAYNLLSRATKVADVQDSLSYTWLSSNELLVKTNTNETSRVLTSWSGYLDLIDTRTGTRTRMAGLSEALLQHRGHYNPIGPWGFQRSPDGQWLLWTRNDPSDGGLYPVAARTDGSQYQEWKVSADSQRDWVDGHRWVSSVMLKQTKYLIIHDAARPQADRTLPEASPEAQALLTPRMETQEPLLSAHQEQNSTQNVVLDVIMQPTGSAPNLPPKQIDIVRFPLEAVVLKILPNPQNTQIALLVNETDTPPAYATLLHRLIPAYTYKVQPVERLCIYRLDKKELYEVGRINHPLRASSLSLDLTDASWLPDGKHIEFL